MAIAIDLPLGRTENPDKNFCLPGLEFLDSLDSTVT